MSASPKQIKLIEDMQTAGAPIPEHPQFDRPDDIMFHSVENADRYIKENIQYYHKLRCDPRNIQQNTVLDEMSTRLCPGDWGVPNH